MSTSAAIDPALPFDWVEGLAYAMGTDEDHDVDVAVGKCRDEDDTYDIDFSSPLTGQLDVTGAGGRDASDSLTSETWYAVFVIARTDTGATAVFFSTSATWAGVGTMPTNYDVGRRIAWVRTRDTANILPFNQVLTADDAGSRSRWTWWEVDGDGGGPVDYDSLLVSEGTATSFTDCPLNGGGANRIAPTAVNVSLGLELQRTFVVDPLTLHVRPNGSVMDDLFYMKTGLATTVAGKKTGGIAPVPVSSDQVFEYRINSAFGNATIHVVGWEDAL